MERSSYEKLSIRDSARSLKKYGSTSNKNNTKNETYVKHYVSNDDTLQGIALKYDVTIEQIRRANKLWASDSLFLKEFLLIPSPLSSTNVCSPSSSSLQSPSSASSRLSFENDSIDDFLGKIDKSIASTKEEVKKTQINSEFVTEVDSSIDRRKPTVSRMKQFVNNNGSGIVDMYSAPQAVVVTQGKTVKTSLQRHEQQQDELFQL